MEISEREEKGITVFVIDGRIDSEGATRLDDTLRRAVNGGKFKMVMDMTAVHYINSAALRTLADIITQNRAKGGDLRLAALPPKVRRVLQIVGVDRFSAIFDSVDEAVKAF